MNHQTPPDESRPSGEVAKPQPTDAGPPSMFGSRDFWVAIGSSILLCGAFPPLELWPMAVIAPIGWLRLVKKPSILRRRFVLSVYLVGFVHWMILIQWVRLPHWSAYFGWIVLSAYLAIYLPLFILSSRVMIHRWGLPLVIAAPVAWTGLELARGYLFTGFSMSLLGHSVVGVPLLTQIADTFGAYGVSFVLMTVAAALTQVVGEWFSVSSAPKGESAAGRRTGMLLPTLWAATLVVVTLVYGALKLGDAAADSTMQGVVNVALIQAVYDTEFDNDAQVARQRSHDAFQDYLRLSRSAVESRDDIDLVIWPESMFSAGTPYPTFTPKVRARPEFDLTAAEWLDLLSEFRTESELKFEYLASLLKTRLLVGMSRIHASEIGEQQFNSVMFVDQSGKLVSIYDKMHPVMFGEYVPFGEIFPWLYRLTPMGAGLTSGTTPASVEIEGIRFSPCICFENTVPHLIRQQIGTLADRGQEPDCLITVTNDGWFWGSSLLDTHLACGIFRAIEMRKPMLIAANTGFSAWIDSRGRVRAKGGRRAEDVVFAEVGSSQQSSPYRVIGDWPAGVFLLSVAISLLQLAVFGPRHDTCARRFLRIAADFNGGNA